MKKFIKIKKSLDIKGFSLYQPCGCFMVEVTGIEPVSEGLFTPGATSVVCDHNSQLYRVTNKPIKSVAS